MPLCQKHAEDAGRNRDKHLTSPVAGPAPLPEDIQRLAYRLYLKRGAAPGYEIEDWIQAERELKQAMAEAHCPTCASNR